MHSMPEFILVGAMKCGTTSIHHLLAAHPRVFMPDPELYFFDVDDVEQHGDFFVQTDQGWTDHDWERDFETYLTWYRGFFAAAKPGQVLGEDSTTYIASKKAPDRIRAVLPEAKLIAILRDPVERAYSHYWHNVSVGRTHVTFDAAMRYQRISYLARGLYREQLERYRWFLEQGRLRILFFEDFVRDPQATMDGLFRYLGVSGSVDISSMELQKNRARVPAFISFRLWLNRFIRPWVTGWSGLRSIPNMPGYDPHDSTRTLDHRLVLLRPLWKRLTRAVGRRHYPTMNPDTRLFLQRYYRRENAGLSELIGQDVEARWPWMSS